MPTSVSLTASSRSGPGGGRRASPFGQVVPVIRVAILFALAAGAWIAAGGALPGGRWFALHLFTLGTLSTLVLGFTQHFADTLTRTASAWPRWPLAIYLAGALGVLGGRLAGERSLLAAGAVVATVGVLGSYLRLRRARRSAVGARFAWVVRLYERAHGAFVHGAVLGALLGTGALPGEWYATGRLAHLHINVLGWAGLTVLATVVFFGPTMLRTRIERGADDRAARALRHGATALTVGVLALLAAAVGGAAGVVLRMGAAAGLAVLAGAAAVVLLPVIRACLAPSESAARLPLLGAALWLLAAMATDVVAVAAGAWWLLDPVGLAALLGGLLQLVLAVLVYLAPSLGRAATTGARRRRLQASAVGRSVAMNTGVTGVVAAALLRAGGTDGTVVAVSSWALVGLALVWTAALVAPRRA